MTITRKLRPPYFWRKYRPEIIRNTLALAIGLATLMADRLLRGPGLFESLALALLVALLAGLVLLSFSIKRRLTWRLENLESIVVAVYGSARSDAEYVRRMTHFREEKDVLCDALVRRHLPALIRRFSDEMGEPEGIDIIIDSGTTLAAVLPKIKLYGYRGLPSDRAKRTVIYTNNISGIDAFNQETRLREYPINENQIHLLGGNPLEKYRATTGALAEEGLKRIKSGKVQEEGRRLVVGILTGNWLVADNDLRNLGLSSKPEAHHQFKRQVAEISDKIIVVCPLGKIFRLRDTSELNDFLREELVHYEEVEQYYEIRPDPERKGDVFLLTTARPLGSFLGNHSRQLHEVAATHALNYTLLKCPEYCPPGNEKQQREIEVPHLYLKTTRRLERVFFL